MNSPMTDVYSIICKEFPDTAILFGIIDGNDKEVASFLHYNTKNMMFENTDEYMYHNVNFKNLDNGKRMRVFTEGPIYFFPKGNDKIELGNDITVLKIDRGTKAININSNGLFIEQFDRNESIVTKYYDNAALEIISKQGLCAGNIDCIEDYIEKLEIAPDKVIYGDVKRETNKEGFPVGKSITIKEVENNEIINSVNIPMDKSRSFYSVYYEYMKLQNYLQVSNEVQKQGKSI